MVSDLNVNAPLSAFVKGSAKKKKGSRLAKLKQSKLDVRNQQWLSQVEDEGYKVETNNVDGLLPSSIPKPIIKGGKTQGNLAMRARDGKPVKYDNNEDIMWMSSSVGRNMCRNRLTKDFSSSFSVSCSSSSSEEERDEGCVDDWEAMEDTLGANSYNNNPVYSISASNPEASRITRHCQGNNRAWSPNDAFRPRSLPSLSKQHTVIQNCLSREPIMLSSSCPICCEDLDVTDSSFLPCPCGFRLCLFCHKRILEVDGRCPGCRKQYDSLNSGVGFACEPAAFRMGSSWIKNTRF